MARTDVIVLGAGIVGASIAVHLAKRGLAVALIDRGGVGEGTSYGNAGVIEGNTVFPPAFPSEWGERLRGVLKPSPLSASCSATARAMSERISRAVSMSRAGCEAA